MKILFEVFCFFLAILYLKYIMIWKISSCAKHRENECFGALELMFARYYNEEIANITAFKNELILKAKLLKQRYMLETFYKISRDSVVLLIGLCVIPRIYQDYHPYLLQKIYDFFMLMMFPIVVLTTFTCLYEIQWLLKMPRIIRELKDSIELKVIILELEEKIRIEEEENGRS